MKKRNPTPKQGQRLDDLFGRTGQSRAASQFRLSHLAVCAFIIGLHVMLLASGRLERPENMILDAFVRARPTLQVHPDIVMIEIDKESIQSVGSWPWPWRYHAQVIDLLREWKVRAVVYDFPFEDAIDFEESKILKESIQKAGNVYLPVSLQPKLERKIWIHEMPIVLEPGGEKKVWFRSDSDIEKEAFAIGHSNVDPDADGVVRRIAPYLSYGGETHPYLALRVGYDYLGKTLPGITGNTLPTDMRGKLWISWVDQWQEGFAHYPFADLVRSSQAIQKNRTPVISPDALKGKICLIGLSDPSLADLKATSLEASSPTFGVQAQILNGLLTDQWLRPASFMMNAFSLCVIGIIASLLFAMFGNIRSFISGLLLGFVWVIFSYIAFSKLGIWFYTIHPLLLIIVLFIFSAIYSQVISLREESRLFDLATRDGLTGLFVIRHFREILNRVVLETKNTKEPLALVLIDIDNFKPVNDTYGHQAGDMVLKKTAQVIASCFRSKRPLHELDFVARYGGEEFIVMLRKANLKDASFIVAERIRAAVEKTTYEWDGKKIPITISLGVACLHEDETIPDLMVRRADEALYRAKRSGKNKVCLETFPGEN